MAKRAPEPPKRGRPPLPAKEKRRNILRVPMTDAELERFHADAAKAKEAKKAKTTPDFARARLLR